MINKHPQEPLTNQQLIDYVRSIDAPKVGILTGGGDAPGGNAVLQGTIDMAEKIDPPHLIVPFANGFWGLVQSPPILTDALWGLPLDFIAEGGADSGHSRVNPQKVFIDDLGRIVEKEQNSVRVENMLDIIVENMNYLGLLAYILIGGDNTLSAAYQLHLKGIPVIGVAKSIDDDYGDVYAFGRHTAVERATEEVDRLRTTCNTHKRDLVIEVMGRKCGRIGLESGIATHADIILLPEFTYKMEDVIRIAVANRKKGQRYNIIVVSEGAHEPDKEEGVDKSKGKDGYGEVVRSGGGKPIEAALMAAYRKEGLGDDSVRYHKVGHIHRAGTPVATDRIRGYRYGVGAMELIQRKEFGTLIGYRRGQYVVQPLETATIEKRVGADEYDPDRLNVRLAAINLIPHHKPK